MLPSTRKLLINNLAFNPFNDKFNVAEFGRLITNYELKNINELYSIIKSFTYLNEFHNHFYQNMVELVKAMDKDVNKVIDLIFVGFNRNYLVNHHLSIEEGKATKEIDIMAYSARKVKSVDKTLNDVNIIDALEADADSLNLISNLIRHIIAEPFPKTTYTNPEEPFELLMSICLTSSVYYTLKSIYEDGLWNNGEFNVDLGNTIHIAFPNSNRQLLTKVGHIRLQTNALEHIMYFREHIEKKSPIGKQIENILQSTKREKKIKDVKTIDGAIYIKLAKKQHLKDLGSEIAILGTIVAYYPFVDLYKPNSIAQGLTISDFIVLLSCIQEILKNVQDCTFDTSLQSFNDLVRYPIKIKSSELNNYLLQRTKYNQKQIFFFFD